MVKFKKLSVLAVSAIMTVASVLNVYAGAGKGYIYKNGTRVAEWSNNMDEQNATAQTIDMTTVHYDKTTYMTVNVKSIYPYGGTHAYYVNATLSANDTKNGNLSATANKVIPTTERGTSAYTKHVIMIEGTAYTPAYENGYSMVVRP